MKLNFPKNILKGDILFKFWTPQIILASCLILFIQNFLKIWLIG